MNDILAVALTQLDEELTQKNLSIEIVICGAYALHLFGYSRSEHTLDVDSITQFHSNEVKQIIETIGQKLGIGNRWLNDQASTVSLPSGILSRTKPLDRSLEINKGLIGLP